MTNPAIVEVVIPGKQGAPGLTPRGAWSGAANYVARDAVTHGNRLWIALAASTNVEPGTDPLTWEVMIDAPAQVRDFVIDGANPLTDALPAALKVNIDAAGGGDVTTGGVGEFLRMSLNGNVVARLRKTGAMELAGMLAIGAVDGAGAGPALKGNGTVLEARLDDDSCLTSMRTKGYEAQLGTLTSQAAGLDISATWNHASIAGPLIRSNVVDSLSDAQALLIDLQKSGVSQAKVDKNGNATLAGQLTAAGTLTTTNGNIWGGSNSSVFSLGAGADVELSRDAANVWAMKRGANAQALRIYDSYTDASNYTRLTIGASPGTASFDIATQKAGTGVDRHLFFYAGTNAIIRFHSAGSSRWEIGGSGHLVPGAGNTYDFGGSGNTVRDIYVGQTVFGGDFQAGSASAISWASRTRLISPGDGIVTFYNVTQSDFGRIQLGGTTATFPAIKRSGPDLHARLADDSGYATMNLLSLRLGGTDVVLERDAAGQLALRNGTNPQRIHVFNTYTDASNYERMVFGFSGNTAIVDVSAAGTGNLRSFEIRTGPGYTYFFSNSGVPSISAGQGGQWVWPNRAAISSPSAGIINLWNQSATDFGRLTFGGSTASSPAIKKSGAFLQARLADDSDFTVFQAKLRSHANATAETPTATHTILHEDGSGTAYKLLAVAA